MRKKNLKPIPKLVALWEKLIPAARTKFAKLARTTSGSMRQYVEARREMTPDLAIRIEKANEKLGLKPLNRTDLSKTCGACEYAKIARRVLKDNEDLS